MRYVTAWPKKGRGLPFDLFDLPRVKKISKGQRISNTVNCRALKNVKVAKLQSIRDGFEKVFQGICAFDQLPREVLDKSSA